MLRSFIPNWLIYYILTLLLLQEGKKTERMTRLLICMCRKKPKRDHLGFLYKLHMVGSSINMVKILLLLYTNMSILMKTIILKQRKIKQNHQSGIMQTFILCWTNAYWELITNENNCISYTHDIFYVELGL